MKKKQIHRELQSAEIDTPLGPMIAIGDDDELYLLEFADRLHKYQGIPRLLQAIGAYITLGRSCSVDSIEEELKFYFQGQLRTFQTPLAQIGTPFQKSVWTELQQIPYGKTCGYADIARSLNRPTAYRAVARANGTNRLAIVIPCHRVIASDGSLGGYASGLTKKQWLLEHEQKH